MAQASQVRTYDPAASIIFLKTKERFGGLSNMAAGFPLRVNGIQIRTSEALYQACRFPHMPDVQRRIIDERSPMTAKMRSKPLRKDSRPDWDAARVKIMRWCLRVKLAQNWKEFGGLLLETGELPIVEQSRKDDFWGAKVAEDGSLVGMNILGRLLMEVREQLKGDESENLRAVEPLSIPEFLLFQKPIETVRANEASIRPVRIEVRPAPPTTPPPHRELLQPSFFEQPMIAWGQMDIQQNNRPAEEQSKTELPTYPAYKPARVHWLGQIPSHWQEKRGKYFFCEIDERSVAGEEELLSVSHTTGVTPRSQKNVTMFKAESYVGHKVARPNDVVINTMWAWMSALGVSKNLGIVSPAYGVYRPLNRHDFLPQYVDYLLRTPLLKWEYICRSTGIRSSRLRLYPDKFLDIALPCPPLVEQERMVAFLHAKELQIRRLIRNKRRLIGLLNEQKQAIINQAVTRGLDPNAPMKPTGIDWMPEVPAQWEVLKLKRFSRMKSGDAITSDEIEEAGQFPVYGGNGLRGYSDRFTHDGAFALVGRQGALCGNVHLVSGQFWASEHAVVTTLDQQNDIRWFVELLRVMNLNQYSESAAQPGLSVDDIANLYAPRPPAAEQAAIADHFRREFREMNAVVERTSSEIALIREFRERLISDVVTGELDVRHMEIVTLDNEPGIDDSEELEEELEIDDAKVMEGTDGDE